MPEYLTVKQACELTQMSRQTIWKAIESGELKAVRKSKDSEIVIREDWIKDWIYNLNLIKYVK